jgi:hypothetical protein
MFPSYAFAATTDEIAEVLFEETTELLEIEIDDADLAGSLRDDLDYAVDEEVVDPEIVEEISDAIDGDRESDLNDLFGENSEEQEASWLEKSPGLLNAFDLVKYEFHQCRLQSTGGASECAQGLGFKLQVASVQLALADLEEQRAALDGLEGVELEEALALIAAQEEELARKLARAEEKLARVGEGRDGSTELQAAVSEAKEAGIAPEANRDRGNQEKQGNGNQGNGNQGNGDRGNQENQGNGNQGNGDRGNQEKQGNGNQGNGDRGNQEKQGNGNQGNGDRGNQEKQGNGNQGNGDRGNQGNGNQGGRGNG